MTARRVRVEFGLFEDVGADLAGDCNYLLGLVSGAQWEGELTGDHFWGLRVVAVRLYGGTFFFSWRREIGIGAGFCCDRVQERLTALGMVMNYRSSVLLPVGKYHRWESRGQSERVVYISIEGEKKVGGEKRRREGSEA